MPSSAFEHINDPIYLRSLIKKVMSQRAPLLITDTDKKAICNSEFIDIDTKKKLLYLDPPNNLLKKEGLRKKEIVNIFIAHDGLEMKFSTSVKEIGRNLSTFVLNLPDSLEYRQRRQNFRVSVGQVNNLPLSLEAENGDNIKGKITDVSVGGLAIVCHIDIESETSFHIGQLLNCTVSIPDETSFNSQLIIRSLRHNQDTSKYKLGVEFKHLSREQIHILSLFINGLQRSQIKRR